MCTYTFYCVLARRLTSALQFCLNFHNPSFIFSIECGYVCPQTGQVCSSSLIIACILLCGVFGSVPLGRASLACLGCVFVWLALGLVISCCFPPEAAGFFPFVVAVPWFWRCCCLLFCLFWRLGCLRCDLLFPVFSLPSPWLSSGAVWSSQSCWSLPPGIWLYLQRSGCHTFGMACRG